MKKRRSFMRAEGPSLLGGLGLGACSRKNFCDLEVLKHHFRVKFWGKKYCDSRAKYCGKKNETISKLLDKIRFIYFL